MLKLLLFSVHDTAAGSFNPPFPAPSAGAAERGFSDAANDKSSPIGQHPEDYHLFQIAEFDVLTGGVTALQAPVRVASAIQYVRPSGPPAMVREA